MRHVFEKTLRLPVSASLVFDWHEQPGSLEKLIPPGEPIRVLEHTGGIRDGARVVLQMGPVRWVAVHQGYEYGRRFQDLQASGPLRYWLHKHEFADVEGGSMLTDHVEFELFLSPVADIVLPLVRWKLRKMFAYRHAVTLAAFKKQCP